MPIIEFPLELDDELALDDEELLLEDELELLLLDEELELLLLEDELLLLDEELELLLDEALDELLLDGESAVSRVGPSAPPQAASAMQSKPTAAELQVSNDFRKELGSFMVIPYDEILLCRDGQRSICRLSLLFRLCTKLLLQKQSERLAMTPRSPLIVSYLYT